MLLSNPKRLITVVLLIGTKSLYSQIDSNRIEHSSGTPFSISGMFQSGHVFATNDFLRGNNLESSKITSFRSIIFRATKQSDGSNRWEQIYKYPYWGAGVQLYDFHNPEELGVPIGVYGTFNAPFIRRNNWSFNYEINFGLSFNWRSFNALTNRYNNAIGASEAFLIDVGLNWNHKLTKHLDLNTAVTLTHFSNGALKKPNFGINTIAPKVSLKYNFFEQIDFKRDLIPQFDKRNELCISLFTGIKNIVFDSVDIDILEKYEGVYYPIFGLASTLNRQISYKSKIGLGLSVSYNGSLDAQAAINNNDLEPAITPFSEKLQLSIFPSYELVIHNFSLVLQPSFYLYRKSIKNLTPVFYQKIGLKYQFNEHFFCGIILRDYKFHVSDFIEWTVGYSFNQNHTLHKS